MLESKFRKNLYAYRTLKQAEEESYFVDSNVDINLFANYYGSINNSNKFNDPILYKRFNLFEFIKQEYKDMVNFWRTNKKGLTKKKKGVTL